ncbi:uncharacterized protein LOC118418407 isoform X2 [Branchiostoma floridae]|uniref:Uncharacterized protein LOC118418407 isoform X2 n=1 Tax=Branchiostoma floridae TaxID=7739 RepID=A0A9J7LDU7_BRAFL|nr:uncharacterized protein LOC118418407 isoform X2 [Branchiostoma floridae]
MLSDVSLRRLAGELGNEWRSLGIFLGLSKAQVDQCDINHPRNIKEAIVDMLVLWQQLTSDRGPEAQVADLVKALREISRLDLAEKVEDGDFIEYTDQAAGNSERPDQVAGNRVVASGRNNVIIQAGNNAKINVNVPAPITEPVTPGYTTSTPGSTSLPDLSRTQPPHPIPRTISKDNSQHSMEAVLNDCIRQLKQMGFSDEGSCRREVQNLISTGLRTTEDIVETFVERNQAQRTPVEQPQEQSMSSATSSTFDSLDGRTTGGRGETPTHGSPPPSTDDVSLGYVSLQLQSGGNIQDNEASNWPETGPAARGEQTTGRESAEETVPKAPPEEANANIEAQRTPDRQRPTETQQQVNEPGADGYQPVYDKKRCLYIFSREDIEKMTNNFTSPKIADGAFGPVYYLEKFPYEGPLKGRQMAVKVNNSDEQGRKEFMQELAMAGSGHPHLLPLFGICEDESCLSLVSPYMANKDLKSWIQDKRSPTDWKTRLVIGLDLISAIRHYHKKTKGPNKKFHCDVKSANVFLDAQNRARLGDPGLMREVSKDKTHLTRTGSSADYGTTYYQDPFYMKYRKYHETSDLYSAGKVLLELLTSTTADTEDENRRLLFEIWFEDLDYFDVESDGTKLCEVADRSPEVGWPECNEDGSSMTQLFAKLIIRCLQERSKNRIKLEDLQQELQVLVQRSAAIGQHNTVVPDWCMCCLSRKPCPIPMACGCALLCSACMQCHTEALYCPNHHKETTGLGYNTFAIIVGQVGFEEDAEGFKDVITNPHICGVREENVKLLKNATIKDVEEAVAEVAGKIQQVQRGQETFFIYYHSGHGQQRGLEFNHTTVWSRNLRKIFKESKATKSLYILDSCMASSVEVYTMKGPQEHSPDSEETEAKEQEDAGDNLGCQGSPERDIYMLPEGSMLWASSRKSEASGKKDKKKLSVFTKYLIKGLRGGNCGTDNCSHCLSFQHQAKATGAVNLNLLRDYVYDHVKDELQNQQIPSLQGQQERTYWMAYAQD